MSGEASQENRYREIIAETLLEWLEQTGADKISCQLTVNSVRIGETLHINTNAELFSVLLV